MREIDPGWQELAKEPFAQWFSEGELKYRAEEIRKMISYRETRPDHPRMSVEIGSNRGRFLKGLCKAFPERFFFGVELKRSLSKVSARRLQRHGLENGAVLNADARYALPIFFGHQSLESIFVLFPDPWWKERHAKRRLLNESFYELAAWVLKPGGHVFVKTDVGTYADAVEESVRGSERFELLRPDAVEESSKWALTTRERHCLEDGLPVYRVYAKLK